MIDANDGRAPRDAQVEVERDAAIEQLEAARAALSEVQQIARVGSWSWSPGSQVAEWSDELFRLFGFDASRGVPPFEALERWITPDSVRRLREDVLRALSTGDGCETEIEVVRADGETLHAIVRARVFALHDGSTQLRGTVADVTELVEARRAHRASEERFVGVVDSLEDSVAVLAPVLGPDGLPVDFTFEWVNARWLRRFNAPRERVAGARVFVAQPHFRELLPALQRVLSGGPSERAELHVGHGLWIETQLTRFDRHIVVVGRDITQRRMSELLLAAGRHDLAEAQRVAKMGSWCIDVETGAVTCSEGVFRLHGLSPSDPSNDVTYDAYRRFMSPADFDLLDAFIKRLIANGTPYEHAYDVVLDDGSRRRLVARGEAVLDSEGKVSGARGTLADVTDLRDLHERVAKAEQSELIGRLAGGIAHDYNNLLAAISLNAELMRDELPEGSALREDADAIVSATERAAALTRRLLAYGRRQVMQPAVIAAAELVESMLPLLRSVCTEAITIAVSHPDEPLRFAADRAAIEQALMSLVLNAREAMPDGGRIDIAIDRVTVAREGVESIDDSFVRVRVIDSGSGIAPDVLPHVFEPFFTTKSPSTGSGMGLASVEGAVVQSGGAVTAESSLGRGSTFTMLLPEAVSAAPSASPPRPSTSRRGQASPAEREGHRARVLLVEDEAIVRTYVGRLLRDAGYDVTEFEQPTHALTRFEADRDLGDLLLTDVLMPQMSGVELARRLGALRPELRVVFMSGYATEQAFRDGVIPQGARFLAKPFTRRDLLDALTSFES